MSRISLQTLQSFGEHCYNAKKSIEITARLESILREQNVTMCYVGSLGFVHQHRGFGYGHMPEKWLERYLEANHHKHDPVFQYAMRRGKKTTWTECRAILRQESNARGQKVLNEASEVGLTDGVIMPVDSGSKLPGAISFGGHDIDLSEDGQASLFLIGGMAYEALRRVSGITTPMPPLLTEREMEVLRWTAEGKSAEVIGKLLKISPHTVRGHHVELRRKYDVVTNVQVVFRAALDGNLRLAAMH